LHLQLVSTPPLPSCCIEFAIVPSWWEQPRPCSCKVA
jgi:hypothetical protein